MPQRDTFVNYDDLFNYKEIAAALEFDFGNV